MKSNNVIKNAYKGLFYNMLLDLKKTVCFVIIISLSIAAFNIVLALIFMNVNEVSTHDGSGSLFSGVIVILVVLFIHIIKTQETSQSKFSFPINRLIYAVTNFVFLLVSSFILLAAVTIVAPIEVGIIRLIDVLTDKLVYVNAITLNSFIIGFVASWGYLFAFGSVTYCLFMYIKKYSMYTIPVITLIFTSIFVFGWFGEIIQFLFLEGHLGVLIFKLSIIGIIANVIAFVPLKRMEVQ